MILQMLQDKTVPLFLKADIFVELKAKEGSQILEDVYELKVETRNYFLKKNITNVQMSEIYSFMDKDIPADATIGYLGNEIISKLFTDLEFVTEEVIPERFTNQEKLFNSYVFLLEHILLKLI